MAVLIPEMQRAISRANLIITNLLDFARGRLGAGIDLIAPRPEALEPTLRGVVGEIEQIADQAIELTIDLPRPIRADLQRLGQLLSNLLGNAVIHGAESAPIRVVARDEGGTLRLAVTNQGEPIPEEMRRSLFLPFSRGETTSLQGLGLGLYIASEIAKAHGGRIDVESDEKNGTTFALTMPARYD
jgi:signal transduction histidine kinase